MSDRIAESISALAPKYVEFLRRLVQIPSPLGQEEDCQLLVAEYMRQLADSVAIVHSRNGSGVNLAVKIAGAGGGASLVLNAHCDIAPAEGDWEHPPHDAIVSDGLLYGRGAQDDKAGIAVILLVAEALQKAGVRLHGDLILHSVVEDETSGNGSKALVEAGFSGDGVVICDGTWPERIIYGHLGQVWLDVSVIGSPVAACVEHRGVNPIYLGHEFITKLRAWADEMNGQTDAFENIERPFFVNVGSFHSGVWYGSVPARADLQIQVGFGPQLQPAKVISLARDLALSVSDRINVRQGMLSTPAVRVPRDNALIARLKEIIEKNSGREILTQAVTGHCDMRHFRTENICLYGPGAGWNAHGINECYRLSDMGVVARNLAEFTMAWCGVVANSDRR